MTDPAIDLLVAHGYKYNAEAGSWSKKGEKPAPVQEPVAVVSGYYGGQCVVLPINPARLFNSGTAFYTAPPAAQKQWVGLTADEMLEALTSVDPATQRLPVGFSRFAYAIEAKLKEKNT
jgi:hypothetical protein